MGARNATAVAGARLVSGGNGSEPVPREELGVAKAEVLAPTGDAGSRERGVESWTRWFAADPESRGVSPGSKLSWSEYLARDSSGWRIPDFEDAIRFEPADGPTFARMGLALLDELTRQQGLSEPLRRHFRDVARWYGRRAVSLSPRDPETWAMTARIFKALGNEEEADASLARALELDASRPERPSANVGLFRAIDLAGKGKWEEADREFGKVVEAAGLPAGPGAAASKLWGSLPFLIPLNAPAQFRDLQLGEPIPGTFEDFDSLPEGSLPAGWTASVDLDQPPGTGAGSPAGLAATDSAAFQNWVTLSASRFEAWTSRSDPDRFRRAASPQWIGNVNDAPVSEAIEGGFLVALSPSGGSRVQRVTTGNFDCSGRPNVHLVFRNLYLQTEGGLGAIEYSIDGGSSWFPAAYLVDASEIVRDSAGKIDAAATLEKEETGVPRLFDAQGRLRGGKLAAFVAAPIGPALSGAIIPRLRGQKAEIRRIEAYPLPRAGGQPRVRLRFTHLAKPAGLWCLDHLGLYDRVSEDRKGRDRVLQPGLNPRILAGIGWENFTTFPLAPGSFPLFSTSSSNRVSPLDPAESPTIGEPPGIARWRRLEGSLYLRRARALAPADGGILLAASAAAARDGTLTDAVGAERAALADRHVLRSAARPLAAIYAARATALKGQGDAPASAVADEIAYLFCEASGESAGMELKARMASAGLLTESRIFVPFRSSWSYFDRGHLPDPRWKESDFDDGNWPAGPGRLGYGGDGEATTVSFGGEPVQKAVTTYFRSAFEVADPDLFADLTLRVQRDDGVVVYLNGEELLRDNLPGGEIGHDTLASSTVDGEQEKAAIQRTVTSRLLRKGRNVLSAEVHQASRTSSDTGFDLEASSSGRLKEPAVPPADLAAIEERLGVPAAIRAALGTSRARAFRAAGKAAECREALDRAAALVPGYPALAYEEALLLDVRGEGEPAYQAYLKAVDGAVALKANPAGHTPLFLPRSLKDSIEPLIAAGARDLAWAAGEIGRAGGKDAEKESAWLLRRSTELDPEGPEGLRGRMEAFVKLDREEEALRVLDRLLTALSWDRPAAPRRAREIKDLLGLKERLLEELSRGEEAKLAREEVFKAPPRDPSLSSKLIDLSPHYNASLYDGRGWNAIGGDVEKSLKILPETFEPRGELRFDLRGLVQLNSGVYPPDCIWPELRRGKDMATGSQRPYPDALTGIRVGTRAASLHFVVSAIYCRLALTPAGTEVARFVIHYADGGQEVVPLLYAVDLVEWWFVREEFQLLDPSRVIWKNPAGDRQLDLKSWKNPRPDQTIESIDFVSAKKPCCPFLVAITAE